MNLKQFIETNYKDGDFMKRFRAFAKDVDGKFLLRYRVKLNVENHEYLIQHSKRFDFDVIETKKKDKRTKEGVRVETQFRVIDHELDDAYMSVSEFIDHVLYVDIDETIRIERLIDVIPYLANSVISNEWKDDVLHIVLSSKSEFDERDERRHENGSWDVFCPAFRKHWEFVRDLIVDNLNDDGRRRTRTFPVFKNGDSSYVVIGEPIDVEWPVEIVVESDTLYNRFTALSHIVVMDSKRGVVNLDHIGYKSADEIRLTYVKEK